MYSDWIRTSKVQYKDMITLNMENPTNRCA